MPPQSHEAMAHSTRNEGLMAKGRKRAVSRHGLQGVTLCISTALVLILLGMVALSVLTARNLSAYVKENLTVTLMLADDLSTQEGEALCKDVGKLPYISGLTFISKEKALEEQTIAMGSDPSEFLGVNPFVGSIELQLKADYANSDSLKWISKQLRANRNINEVSYPQDLMDSVNRNMRKVNMVLLALAALLTFVSFTLINNSIRLGIYSRRFSIRTMKLVGASWGFIRRPFIARAVGSGIVAAVIAMAVLGGCVAALYNYEPGVLVVITWRVMAVTAAVVMAFGVLITMFCSWLSVNKFLRMKAGDLYK